MFLKLANRFILVLLALATFGCDASINKSIRIADGESVSGSLTSVNGSISIGNDAKVSGSAQTVNGKISVGDNCQTQDLSTVNGSINVGGNVQVAGNMESVNGSIASEAGTTIDGDVQTINGRVSLTGTRVDGEIETRNGSIILAGGSHVSRDVRIEGENITGNSKVEVRLTDGSVIEGDLIVEDKGRTVKVTVDATSAIKGEVRGAEVEQL